MASAPQTLTLDSSLIEAHAGLKAVILAAGKDAITANGEPLVLKTLGERSILQCVVENALQVVRAEDIYVVVGYRQEDVRAHLGPKFHYVVQQEALGTGHAMLQVSRVLKDTPGNLLILYGDTPLFRPDSIRGLLNRHQLLSADLTLLTANVDRTLPYGRIIRDAAGQIIDIIEDTEASPDVRQIHELNVGAYVVNAGVIAVALESLTPSPRDGEYRLTDCVHQLIRSGLRVASYQLYDQDEVQGINTRAGPGAGRVHPAKAAISPAPPGGTEHGGIRNRRLARHHRRRLHHAQRPAAEPGFGERDNSAQGREARRPHRLRPPILVEPGSRSIFGGLCRQ